MAPRDNYERVGDENGIGKSTNVREFLEDYAEGGDTGGNMDGPVVDGDYYFNNNNGYNMENDNFTSVNETTMDDSMQRMVSQVYNGSYENLPFELSEWQKAKLDDVRLSTSGIRCYLKNWLYDEKDLVEGTFCNATWDNFYCWPPTPTGVLATRNCSEVLLETQPAYAHHIAGSAFRVCLDNGTWLWGNWTNYTECADSYDEYVRKTEEERNLVVVVQYILFIGSILSVICLVAALAIFYYFKCLWCDRVTVHVHLMIALLLRSVLLFIITEPFIFGRTNHYRTVDFVCKIVLCVNLYATVSSINWMFIQGVYLHGKLTTNVFDRGTPFKVYYSIGWVLPLALLIAYVCVMETTYPVPCWKDYSEQDTIWILLGPMIFCLLVNFVFLINIMRILLTTVQRTNSSSDAAQFRRAVKATIILFPLLGVNNLFFLYNPGGEYNKYFVVLNTLFGSTQGISVAILYCFVSKDVRDAIRREYGRYAARRNANSMRRTNTRSRKNRSTVAGQPANSIRTRTHFRSKLKKSREDVSGTPRQSNSPETANTLTRNETPSPPSLYTNFPHRNENGNNNSHHRNHNDLNPTILQTDTTQAIIESAAVSVHDNRYTVTIPLSELK